MRKGTAYLIKRCAGSCDHGNCCTVLDLPPRPLTPLPIADYRLSVNPVLNYEYRPGYTPSDRHFDWSHRGFAMNSAGFRDYEYAETKLKRPTELS